MVYSIIQKSQLEGAHRIDAEYYQPEFLNVKDTLLSKEYFVLGKHAFITDGEHGSVEFTDHGIRYLTAENIQEGFINSSDARFVSELVDKRNRRASLLPDDVVISIKGTVGQAAIAFDENIPSNMNRDVSRIHVKDSINPYYLVAFLNSKFGRGQTLRESSGNVQQMTTLGRIRELLIPIISDSDASEIELIIRKARNELKNSETSYQQAEDLLLEELGLSTFAQDLDDNKELSWIVNLSDVKSANRVDAEYFQPKYEKILKKLKGKQTDVLKNHFQILRGKNFAYYHEGEAGVIKTKQLRKQFIDFQVEDRTKNETIQKENLPTIKDSDVVFASMGVGSLGKTNIFYAFETNGTFTIDSTIRIFRSKNLDILPEVLAVYLSSSIGQELIYKYIVGSSGIISIYENYLSNFPIPVLPKETQQKIAELVRMSHGARKKSKELLEEAKRKVEEMIENEGKN